MQVLRSFAANARCMQITLVYNCDVICSLFPTNRQTREVRLVFQPMACPIQAWVRRRQPRRIVVIGTLAWQGPARCRMYQ